jgi:anhydro-N-acetylmuramic acid kinase
VPHPLAVLLARSQKRSRIIVGLLSGTSADSVDAAVCRLEGQGTKLQVELLQYQEQPLLLDVKRQVLGAASLDIRAVAELNVQLGEAFAEACLMSLRTAGVSPEEVDLIGSHGQTVYHHSGVAGTRRATLQLGDGDVIAVRTGIHVVSDFRARDIAAGGEGAPLSPVADAVLFGHRDRDGGSRRRAILNLGGIANVTVLDDDPAQILGFDTGPANAPLDRLARRLSEGALACDQDGRFARAGRVNEPLLAELLDQDPFVARQPPKSTGFEMYGDAFLSRVAERHGGYDVDLMATLTDFVARTVGLGFQHCSQLGSPVAEIIAAGGGVRNPVLLERITATVKPILIRRSDELGVPADAREAMAFAVLADMTLRGVSAVLPPITGASSPKLLGKISFP